VENRERLLRRMADGRFHSGEELGAELGVTRAAVWKALRGLEAYGLDVQAVPGRGYRLAEPLELLERSAIAERLGRETGALLGGLEIHPVIDSTNAALRRRVQELPGGYACLAEYQEAGRGRRGRDWVSPFARNLYLSLTWHFDGGSADLSGLSLAVAVAVLRALGRNGVAGVGVKWPNDLLWGQRKLAGVLLEVAGEANGPWRVVTGVGLNVRMPADAATAIDQPWVDVETVHPGVARNQLAGDLLDALLLAHARYARDGFEPFREEWRAADCIAGREVILHTAADDLEGRARGVDDHGALLLEAGGAVHRCVAGEVSLRLAERHD